MSHKNVLSIDQIDFGLIHEGINIKEQVENFKKLNVLYPEPLQQMIFK